jgi:hypothetical protein
MDYIHSYEWNSSWKEMTSKGRLVFPKNVKVVGQYGESVALTGTRANVGGFITGVEPLFLRGDRVVVKAGYKYQSPSVVRTTDDVATIIDGYISKVYSNIPLELDVEDSMWILKQTAMKNTTFTESDTLEDILKLICNTANTQHGTTLTYNALASTNFGAFIVENETAAQLLNRLNNLYGFNSYFRGTELRCGVKIYNEDEAQTQYFIMNGNSGNVPVDGQDLQFQRKDDIVLSAIAHNTITKATGATTKDGHSKTKRERLQVLVTIRDGIRQPVKVIANGERVPENQEGERRTFFFPEATTTTRLAELAFEQLEKYAYDGLIGSFQSFGIPYVQHGDNVSIKNPNQPDQTGIYRVKGASYSGGVSGQRQQIELHYKIT